MGRTKGSKNKIQKEPKQKQKQKQKQNQVVNININSSSKSGGRKKRSPPVKEHNRPSIIQQPILQYNPGSVQPYRASYKKIIRTWCRYT